MTPTTRLLLPAACLLLAVAAARAQEGEGFVDPGERSASAAARFVPPTTRPGDVFIPMMDEGPGPLAHARSEGVAVVIPTTPPGAVFIPNMNAGPGPDARAASPLAPR